jgi:hypothetical protein
MDQAMTWARGLRLVKVSTEGRQLRLQLTATGQEWLSGNFLEQQVRIYDVMRAFGARRDVDADVNGFTFFGMNPFNALRPGELRFFGEYAAALKVDPKLRTAFFRQATTSDELALRDHVDRALAVLKPGVFYRLDSVATHVAFGDGNPLNRGVALDQLTVYVSHHEILTI